MKPKHSIALFIIALHCSAVSLFGLPRHDMNADKEYERVVFQFSEIPKELLEELSTYNVNNSEELTAFEIRYLSFIFGLNSGEYDLYSKKICFIKGKDTFFKDEQNRYCMGLESGVGCMSLHIFSPDQKDECYGYDAVITFWCIFKLRHKQLIRRIKFYVKDH